MIQIVNWLLTRRCNLNCEYCGIANKDIGEEMSFPYIAQLLNRLKLHNPNAFHILYGGEPLLRDDLPEIVHLFNVYKVPYTIISNSSPELDDRLERLLQRTEVKSYTASIDPLLNTQVDDGSDIFKKSFHGYATLKWLEGKVKDRVAEITVSKDNVEHLYDMVSFLSKEGIISDITWIDKAHTADYDFSNIVFDHSMLSCEDVFHEICKIMSDDSLLIHMKDKLLPRIIADLPSRMDCELEKGIHNITIDANGKLRLCLRIKGQLIGDATDFINADGTLHRSLLPSLSLEKLVRCKGCNWTCMRMSQIIAESPEETANLNHE